MDVQLRFDYPDRPPLELVAPDEVLVATSIDEVVPALRRADAASRSGRWVAGFVAYDAAPAFEPAMRVRTSAGLPLLLLAIFGQPRRASVLPPPRLPPGLEIPAEAAASFIGAVATIREAIARGDVYQVNHTLRLEARAGGGELALYHHLLRAQGTAYGACLRFGDQFILSASPELFFRRRGERIEARPMKGTRPRGRFAAEDAALAAELHASEKDRAENLMIVDLLRNDIGRIARFGSVSVPALFEIERYRTVWQMCSTIAGVVPRETGLDAVFAALFPCGSVTGAPKIAAMSFIRDLEDTPRGPYCGAIGIVEPGGDCVFSVAIRTAWIDSARTLHYGVGCGITWDSSGEAEWDEALAKAAIFGSGFPEFRLLETMRAANGAVPRLHAHLDRMQESAAYFGFRFERDDVCRAVLAAARPDAELRLRVTSGPDGDPEVRATPLEPPHGHPVRIAVASVPVSSRDPFLFHKTTHRTVYEERAAAHPDVFDVLLLNERGEATEFTRGNLVVELDGARYTPPRTAGLLAGVLRGELLAAGAIRERTLPLADVRRADRLWFINSVRGWIEVAPLR